MKLTYHALAETRLTRHAHLRMQQRSIPAAIVDLLLDYGEPMAVGGGATSYRFTRQSWADAVASAGSAAARIAKYRKAYVIESSDGTVITAAWLQ